MAELINKSRLLTKELESGPGVDIPSSKFRGPQMFRNSPADGLLELGA